MGWRYVLFRVLYQLKKRFGLLKVKFPTNPPNRSYPSLEQWKNGDSKFFFDSREDLDFARQPDPILKVKATKIIEGTFPYFTNNWKKCDEPGNWRINPQTGFTYDKTTHWSKLEDFSATQGDIKYVWERSRFTFVYQLIRYDYHFKVDLSKVVLDYISSWINDNPINSGPNYICSQEIGLRVLNWISVLYYYRNSPSLTPELFNSIIHHLYWQMDHVYNNLEFSRKAVRNNHIITESLALYISGLVFPAMPDSQKFKITGKRCFEEEIAYQVYDDGTYLQFSMNYHRLIAQLMTWYLLLAKANDEHIDEKVSKGAQSSLDFLLTNLQKTNGRLPNYGANDGAFFFQFSGGEYRDYRPQLNALHFALKGASCFNSPASIEELNWYSGASFQIPYSSFQEKEGASRFNVGGYYCYRDQESYTMIRCGNHSHRPSQADNLHLDLWYKDRNIMRDAGSYKYNSHENLTAMFNGTAAHNTITLNGADQMLKGPRFIWLYWTQALSSEVEEDPEKFVFSGAIKAFRHLGKNIVHTRKVTKKKNYPNWTIEDYIQPSNSYVIRQWWNPSDDFFRDFSIKSCNKQAKKIAINSEIGWYSTNYGVKTKTERVYFETKTGYLRTEIDLKRL